LLRRPKNGIAAALANPALSTSLRVNFFMRENYEYLGN